MITCHIFTPEGTSEDLETDIVIFDAPDARHGIVSGQMPTVLSVEEGQLTVSVQGKRVSYQMGEGVVYFKDDVATFLVSSFG